MSRRSGRTVPLLLALALLAAGAAAPAEAGRGRGRGHGRHHGHHHGHHSHWSPGFSFALGYGVGHYYRPYRSYYPVSPAYVYTPVHYRDYAAYGSIETDVKPDSAAVYLNGAAIGIADDFNGWPGKLDVPAGRHELEFREPGYQPLRVTVEVLPRHSVRIAERLAWSGSAADERGAAGTGGYRRDSAPGYERAERSGRRGTLVLEVDTPDAAVYVDGRKQPALSAGRIVLELEAGSHRLEVVKPGYDVFSGEVVLREGQKQELSVRLSPNDGRDL